MPLKLMPAVIRLSPIPSLTKSNRKFIFLIFMNNNCILKIYEFCFQFLPIPLLTLIS